MYTEQPKDKGGDTTKRSSGDRMYTVSTQTQAKAADKEGDKRESSGAHEKKSDSIRKPLNTTTTSAEDSDDDNDDEVEDDMEGQNYDLPPPTTTTANTIEAKAARRALIISTVAESRRTKSQQNTSKAPSKTSLSGQKGQNYDSSYFHRSKQLKDYVINLKQTIQRSNGAIFLRRNEDFIATQELYPITNISSSTNTNNKSK